MTKEDLMQIKQLLDEQKQDITGMMDQKLQTQKQDITGMMDQKLQTQKQDITGMMDQKLQTQKQEIAELMDQKLQTQKQEILRECNTNMRVLIESMVQPQFNLLAEGLADIQEKLVPRSRVDELEEEIKFMKVMYRQMAEDIAKLKKAQ